MNHINVKGFLKQLYKLKKVDAERKKNRQKISSRVQKIKDISLNKKISKRTIEDEFNLLEGEIVQSLEKERQIIDNQNRNKVVIDELKKQVGEISKKLSQEKKNTEIYDNILHYMKLIHESVKIKEEKDKALKQRFVEIEKKITKKTKPKNSKRKKKKK